MEPQGQLQALCGRKPVGGGGSCFRPYKNKAPKPTANKAGEEHAATGRRGCISPKLTASASAWDMRPLVCVCVCYYFPLQGDSPVPRGGQRCHTGWEDPRSCY
jgi:hypothetical protein